MRIKNILFVVGIAGMIVTNQSCTKDIDHSAPAPTPVDVYAIGWVNLSNSYDSLHCAVVWKNDSLMILSTRKHSFATGIAVSGKDVYVSGFITTEDGITFKPVYWKNGVLNELPTLGNKMEAWANAIFVSNNDVYVAGNCVANTYNFSQVAVYWKNGVLNTLSNGTTEISTCNSIFVSGNDVFVSGQAMHPLNGFKTQGVYWKNKVASYAGHIIKSIFVSGNDVYTAGADAIVNSNNTRINVATYWKNGVATTLKSQESTLYSIFVSGTDVYTVSGNDLYITGNPTIQGGTICWKNDVMLPLTIMSDNYYSGRIAYSVFALGADVYVAGGAYTIGTTGIRNAAYWKNGALVTLLANGNTAAVEAVTVVAR